ncbi:hypothetical protein BDW74DRAFT_188840 [Aspergillus multicolor]|uniref:glycosyltransferase family 2 protein n=1 Tax=Aspergillus multicolor TaxID=41759 RepID=UPI003CCCAF85
MAEEVKPHVNPSAGFHSSGRLYAVLNYNYILFPLTLALTYYVLSKIIAVTGYHVVVTEDNSWDWSTVLHFLMNVFFLCAQYPPYSSVLGLCLPIKPHANKTAVKWRTFNKLRVCLVTKGTNYETVLQSARHWDIIRHPGVEFHVVVDGENGHIFKGALPAYIHIDDVPNAFEPKQAKYKARVLEFFRQKWSLGKDDWVLHLDEESEIDEYALQTCLDFIERGQGDIGMGTIYYNGASHWSNSLLSAAEVMRIADDYGRFQLPVRLFDRPLLGWMHGSWILINGAVENKVTWDTACVAEDFWFAYSAVQHGYKFGWLHAIVREQPPCTISDFFKQRRRWYTGILSIDSEIVQFMLTTSILGVACFLLLPLCGVFGWRTLVPRWYFYWILFNDVTTVHGLIVASVMQDMTMTDIAWVDVGLNALKTVALSPVVHLMQAAALVSAWIEPSKGFNVINKI